MDAKDRIMNLSIPEPNSGCWLWAGTVHGKGYGHIWYKGSCKKAHRASYEEFVGKIPEDMYVMHKCDNPACVNPDHLMLGTNQDNMDDRNNKMRQAHGESHSKAKLTDKLVLYIRSLPEGFNQSELAKTLNIKSSTISNLLSGRTWRHLLA